MRSFLDAMGRGKGKGKPAVKTEQPKVLYLEYVQYLHAHILYIKVSGVHKAQGGAFCVAF